jgi:ArsR family transcriptional regulator, virulence genes transcriptional regulator
MSANGSIAATRKMQRPILAQVEDHAGDAAVLLKALGNEQRLLVLCTLLDGPHSVGEINARVRLSQSALSQHLAVLRAAGIVTTRRESQTIWYEIVPGPANHVMEALYAAFCAPQARGRRGASKLQSRAEGECN